MRLAPSAEQRAFAAAVHGLLTASDPAAVSAAWADGDTGPGRRLWAALGDLGVTGLLIDGDRITGSYRDVLGTAAADTLLIAVAGEIVQVDGAVLEPQPTLDLSRPLTTVWLDRTLIVWRDVSHTLAGLRDLAHSALAAEQLGAAERALQLTVEYVKVRQQFGRPIGAFQVLQHRLADLYVRVQEARSVTGNSTVAKVWCSETLRAVAAEMTQMHGGIAITWEHDAHRYLRRAWASAGLFGTPADGVARLAREFLDT